MSKSGLLIVDKPTGISSFGVVGWARRILSADFGSKAKVGHTGTLDPFASGLMILVVGDYCKRAAEFSGLDKSYQAEILLGKNSSTGDPEGEISDYSTKQPSLKEVRSAIKQLTGEIYQHPPIYSAIKIGGQRAYRLAREGKKFEVPRRKVTIYQLDIISYRYPTLKIVTKVSKGTYIRTLSEDIGKILGTGAYTKSLRRLTVGGYGIEKALDLEKCESLEDKLVQTIAI